MWDGIFQADLYDQTHRTNRSSVALTVFAVGRWVGFLRLALSPGGTHDLSSPFHGAVGDFSAILFECNKHNLFLMDMHSLYKCLCVCVCAACVRVCGVCYNLCKFR
jgi:hypothetical protein